MKVTAILALSVALVGAGALRRFADEPTKRFPVSRVVTLLEDMKAQLQKEADADEAIYEKNACWCETNDKEKTQSISDAADRLKQLEGQIERDITAVATLEVEIPAIHKEIEKDQNGLAQAVELRERQSSEFQGEEKESLESIRALGAALVVLEKHHKGDSALLTEKKLISKVATIMEKNDIIKSKLTAHQTHVLASFMQGVDYFDSSPTFKQAYSPQSGEIFGILQQMKQTFEENLAASQREEIAAKETFVALKAAKEQEIAASQARLEEKKILLASTTEKLVQAKEDREDTTVAKKADEKFLQDLKSRCSMTDAEWEERQQTRMTETQAISKAIEILSSDESRELFSKTFNAQATTVANTSSFLQVELLSESVRRTRAADVLLLAATKSANPKMMLVANSARLDAFTRVKKAIDDLVSELVKEQADDVEHRESCIQNLHENEVSTDKEKHSKTQLEMKVEGLESRVSSLQKTIDTLEADIVETQKQRDAAKATREEERQHFNVTQGEQQQAQALLQEAHTALSEAYESITAALVQQAPPKGFDNYQKQRSAPGVLAMIEQIIKDSQLLEKELVESEFKARDEYHAFVQQSQVTVDAKNSAIVDRRSDKAKAEEALLAAQGELEGVTTEIANLATGAEALHQGCDFEMKNFDTKAKGIQDEIDALRQAKAFLSGMQAE